MQFSDRTQLSIAVHPDLRVVVAAPARRPIDEVLAHVRRRTPWIAKQISHFEQYHPLPSPKRYVSGETHRYLGRQYRLRIITSEQDDVRIVAPFLVVETKTRASGDSVRRLVDAWFQHRAKVVLPRYVERCLSATKSLELESPRIMIRKLEKRWGSCTKAGTVILNTELVKGPPYCIEYVILHELCHLRVHDHSPQFFQLLTRFMPDWKHRKRRLDAFVI